MSPIGYKPPVSEFLTPDEKKEWADKKYQFNVVSVNDSKNGKFGEGYVYKLKRVDKKSGEVETKLITMNRNARRDEEFAWFMDIFRENPNAEVGPMTLGSVPTDLGNDAWVFNSAE